MNKAPFATIKYDDDDEDCLRYAVVFAGSSYQMIFDRLEDACDHAHQHALEVRTRNPHANAAGAVANRSHVRGSNPHPLRGA